MAKKRFTTLAFGLLAALLLVGLVEAKGPPAKVMISGPGLSAPIEISDAQQLEVFSFFQFENVGQRIPEPEDVGQGYVITRYIDEDSTLIEWDRLIYYPQPDSARDIVFLEGLLQPDMSTEFDGFWYVASPAGEALMQQLLQSAGVSAVEAAAPSPQLPVLLLTAMLLLLILATVGIVLVRRRTRPAYPRESTGRAGTS